MFSFLITALIFAVTLALIIALGAWASIATMRSADLYGSNIIVGLFVRLFVAFLASVLVLYAAKWALVAFT